MPSSQLFVVVVWNFELYMLPLALLLLLVWNYFFSTSRDTSDMVRVTQLLCMLVAQKVHLINSDLITLQSVDAMFEWEDEEEDKDDKVL